MLVESVYSQIESKEWQAKTCQCVYITVQFTQSSGIVLCSLYVLFSLILYNNNVNSGGDMKFSMPVTQVCIDFDFTIS